jgi:hypothetical protein
LFGDYPIANECHDSILISTSLNSSVVSDTLFEYCDCVPEWMGEEGVYFDPVATLFLAIIAVLAFIILERFRPVVRLTMKWFWYRFIGKLSLKTQLKKFLTLPIQIQMTVQTGLQLKFSDMPNILKSNDEKKESPKGTSLDSKLENNDDVDLDSNTDVDLLKDEIIAQSISEEFIKWFENLEESARDSKIEEFLNVIFSSLEAQVEEIERLDTTVMFLVQILLGIWVLIDYFALQEWPSGGWKCRWAYFSGVVMFKSFTIPLWSCLTTACHYTFAHQLYKNQHRDPTSGTPFGAPIVRNKLTIVMLSVVAFMLGTWLFVTMIIALPLMLAFAPVVMLPAFVVPVSLFIGIQKTLKWAKQMFHVDQVEKLETNMKPVPFVETVFVLKAAATQLVSVAVLCFLLLPLYEYGFKWWTEGASLFVYTNFDLPSLRLRFSYTLSWPEFEQPRLQIQLAMGVFLIGIHSILKITKRVILMRQEYVNFDEIIPGFYEELVVSVLSQCSWRPFRSPMDGAQTALEVVMSLTHTRFVMWFYSYKDAWLIQPYAERSNKRKACLAEWLIVSMVGLPLFISAFIYYLFVSKRAKHFGVGTADEDIIKFTETEDCMVFTDVVIDEGCKATDFSVLQIRCPWIEVSRFVSFVLIR